MGSEIVSLKKWNTLFVIAVPVGAALAFELVRLLVGAHMRLIAWIALFLWLIFSQVWYSRSLAARNAALQRLWALAERQQLTAKDLRQYAPQYSTAQWAQTQGERPQFLPSVKAVAAVTTALAALPNPTQRHHRNRRPA